MLCSPTLPYHLAEFDDRRRFGISPSDARAYPVQNSSCSPSRCPPVVRLVIEMSVGSAVSGESIAWRDRARAFWFVSIARECAR